MPDHYHPFTSTADVEGGLRLALLNTVLRTVVKRRLKGVPAEAEPIQKMRVEIEGLAGRLMSDDDEDLTVVDGTVGEVAVERITPESPRDEVILYIHGGAFIMCSPLTHRGITKPLARYTGCEVIVPEYRLAPEHPYPAAVEDVLTVYQALVESGSAKRVTIAGDSAGGNLVLALLHAAKAAELPMPSSAVCLSPITDLTGSSESIRTNIARDALLPGERLHDLTKLYLNGAYVRNPTASPLFGDFDHFPPLLFHVGDCEILLDDSRRAVEKARRAGVETHLRIWPNLPHVFHAFSSHLPVAHVALKEVADFMLARFSDPE